jgi:outer membrane protein assembly factor BamD (BamD/ComL family)
LRRSSPIESKRWPSVALILIGSGCYPCLSGCSLLSPREAMLSDYDQTRRSIENPTINDEVEEDGVFRPEGVTAEKGEGDKDFFTRVGLKAKRRKDITLAKSLFAEGEQLYKQAAATSGEERAALFRQASEKFQEGAKNWQSSSLEQDALMWAAESHFFAEDYYQAEQLYAKLIKEYPRNPYLDHVDSRRFEIADYWLKTDSADHKPFVVLNISDPKYPWNDTGGHGKRVLEKMRLDNPTGEISDDATMRLAVEDFQKGKYESAADTFADLRLTFPDSEHQFNAQFFELQSLLNSYRGPDYSSIPLTDAQQRVKQIVRQFPQEAAQKKDELNQAYSKIRFQMAERIWKQADYRRKRGENGSAKFHYERILELYADTPYASQATEMLKELEGLPADPPQRFKSLVWMFGSDLEDRPWLKDTPSQE